MVGSGKVITNPTLNGGIELHIGESKERIKKRIGLLMHEVLSLTRIFLLQTARGIIVGLEHWEKKNGEKQGQN